MLSGIAQDIFSVHSRRIRLQSGCVLWRYCKRAQRRSCVASQRCCPRYEFMNSWPRRSVSGRAPQPLSPVSTAACLQLAACIPNFVLQEYPGDEASSEKSEIVDAVARAVKETHCSSRTAPASVSRLPRTPPSRAHATPIRHVQGGTELVVRPARWRLLKWNGGPQPALCPTRGGGGNG